MTLNLSTVFPLSVVKANQCQMKNLVEIAQPAGGTPKNTDASDDTADASASVDDYYCQPDPPPPPPPIDCPPGYIYDDGQCVPKGAECPRGWSKTSVSGKCCPPGESWNGRECRGQVTIPPVIIPPPVVKECPPGMREVPVSSFNRLRKEGWSLRFVERRKLCGRPGIVCPRGTHRDGGKCVPDTPKECKPPLVGKWPDCWQPPKPCPRGTVGPGQPNCKPIVVPCPRGTVGPGQPNCKPIVLPCPRGTVGPGQPNCRPIVLPCPRGTVGPGQPNCRPIVQPCPRGTVGPGQPNCKPIVLPCPRGTVGPGQPNCKSIVKPCPRGTVGPGQPNCKPIVKPCPRGTVGPGQPNCRKIVKPCPRGTVGPGQPNCRAIHKNPPLQLKGPVRPVQPQTKPIKRPQINQKLNLR